MVVFTHKSHEMDRFGKKYHQIILQIIHKLIRHIRIISAWKGAKAKPTMALHTFADVAQNSHLASSVGFIKGAFDALSEFGQRFPSEEGSQVVILRDKCLQMLGLVMTCPYLIMKKMELLYAWFMIVSITSGKNRILSPRNVLT